MRISGRRRAAARRLVLIVVLGVGIRGIWLREWRGLNSLPLPGTQGSGPGSFRSRRRCPMSTTSNKTRGCGSRTSTVGNVTKISRQGWHALVTMTSNGDVDLPENATAKLGQTSLLGSQHIELAPPTDTPTGRQAARRIAHSAVARRGSTQPPSRRLAAAVDGAQRRRNRPTYRTSPRRSVPRFRGREKDLRSLIEQLDRFTAYLDDQSGDIIAAAESLNRLVGQFAEQQPVRGSGA